MRTIFYSKGPVPLLEDCLSSVVEIYSKWDTESMLNWADGNRCGITQADSSCFHFYNDVLCGISEVKVISVIYLGDTNPNSWGCCQSNRSLRFVSTENHSTPEACWRFEGRFHCEGEKVWRIIEIHGVLLYFPWFLWAGNMYNCSVGSPGDCGFAASMACISPAAQQDHHRGAPSSDLCLSICSCLAYFSGLLLGNCRCFFWSFDGFGKPAVSWRCTGSVACRKSRPAL